MANNEQYSMKESFFIVRDIYRNCARILLSADFLMQEKEFSRTNWAHIYDIEPIDKYQSRSNKLNTLNESDALLTGYILHQYTFEEPSEKYSVITICTVPWRKSEPEFFKPCCCITLSVFNSDHDDVYWIGALPIWQKENVTDGKVHSYNSNMDLISETFRSRFKEIVLNDGKVIGISIPLDEVTSSDVVKTRLINPIIEIMNKNGIV